VLGQTLSVQHSAYSWAAGHRMHHKYLDTDADPHNTMRGWLFTHVGWFFMTQHPDVVTKEKRLDNSDLEEDHVIMFQHKHYQ
jgi:stearoyl-CoA desaturase (delta-9 desaturase)